MGELVSGITLVTLITLIALIALIGISRHILHTLRCLVPCIYAAGYLVHKFVILVQNRSLCLEEDEKNADWSNKIILLLDEEHMPDINYE